MVPDFVCHLSPAELQLRKWVVKLREKISLIRWSTQTCSLEPVCIPHAKPEVHGEGSVGAWLCCN